MARRRIAKLPRRASQVETIEVDGRQMVTVESAHAVASDRIVGSFVRLQPTPGDTAEALQTLKRELLKMGAQAVKILPVPRTEAAVEDMAPSRVENDERPMRQVVMDRAERANNVDDRPALVAALDESLDAAGL